MSRSDQGDGVVTHDTARDESQCGVFCDAEPEVSFEAFGYIFHWCRECYEEPCSRCQSKIAQGEGENRAKGWCQSCREEIRLICGDDDRGIQKEESKEQATLLTDGGRDQSGVTDRCGVCGERVAGVVDALEHYLAQHPRSDLLHNTLSEVSVRTECSECGETFTTVVSVGIDAKPDTATLTVPSYCDECVDSDPISGLIVREMAPDNVLSREVPSDA